MILIPENYPPTQKLISREIFIKFHVIYDLPFLRVSSQLNKKLEEENEHRFFCIQMGVLDMSKPLPDSSSRSSRICQQKTTKSSSSPPH